MSSRSAFLTSDNRSGEAPKVDPGMFDDVLKNVKSRQKGALSAFDKAIAARAGTIDPFYRRGVCAILTGDAAAALPDLERTVAKEPGYDFYRAAGLLAHSYALTGEKERAEALFREVTDKSVASETYLNFAELLASEGKNAEARGRRRCSTRSLPCRDIRNGGSGGGSAARASC